MKLVSMTDFVLNQDHLVQTAQKDHGSAYGAIFKYAKFLKQPLELWMFVPCDKNGVVLKKPNLEEAQYDAYYYRDGVFSQEVFSKACNEFKEAKDRVLFGGFTYHSKINENLDLVGYIVSDVSLDYLRFYISKDKSIQDEEYLSLIHI